MYTHIHLKLEISANCKPSRSEGIHSSAINKKLDHQVNTPSPPIIKLNQVSVNLQEHELFIKQ